MSSSKPTKSVKFTTNRKGRRMAWQTGGGLNRWVRVGLAEAELMVATGEAVQVAADAPSFNALVNGR